MFWFHLSINSYSWHHQNLIITYQIRWQLEMESQI